MNRILETKPRLGWYVSFYAGYNPHYHPSIGWIFNIQREWRSRLLTGYDYANRYISFIRVFIPLPGKHTFDIGISTDGFFTHMSTDVEHRWGIQIWKRSIWYKKGVSK